MSLAALGQGKASLAGSSEIEPDFPLYYLDMLWHKPDKTNVSSEQFDAGLKEIMEKDRWIIDGNYLRTMERRIQMCDTVFLLDYPLEICLEGAKSRIGKEREDLPWKETVFDEEFRQWILDFSRDQLPVIYELLKKYKEKKIIVFRAREEAGKYLKNL